MTVIEGREEVRAYCKRALDREWMLLNLKHRRVRWKILFALLLMTNYKFSIRSGKLTRLDIPLEQDLLRFRLLLRILDEFLVRKWTQVDIGMKPEEVLTYARIIDSEFLKLGILRNLLLTVVATKAKTLTVVETEKDAEAVDQGLESAYEQWVIHDRLDGDWIEYYYKNSTRGKRIAEQVRKETRRKLGTTQEGIHRFSRAMARLIRANLKQPRVKEAPFLCMSKDQILSLLNPTVGAKAAESFFEELKYAPGKSWSRSPYVVVTYNRDTVYVPLFSAFNPANVFMHSWLDYISREVKGSSALGMMGRDWGKLFEVYVRHKLRECHPHLKVDDGNTVLDSNRFPDMRGCLNKIRKTKVEIDVIAYSTRRVYLISCKAPNQFRGPDMIESLEFLRAHEFGDSLVWDIRMAGEIEEYARCVRQSAKYLESRGFQGKEVMPVLVTSDFRPLSVAEVRTWMLGGRIVPSTLIIQAKRLAEFPFE